jgi:hypothetical protein
MKDEVEEFLRRAAARRAQAEAKRREQQQQAQQQAARPLPQRPAPIARPPLQPVAEEVVEIIDAEEADTTSRFSSSVSQHMRGTTDIARHASSLGAEVDQADDKLEARLHRTFDHKLGQLKDTTTAATPQQIKQAADPSSSAANMARLLANPQSIRNAIILSEILNRPEDRWK